MILGITKNQNQQVKIFSWLALISILLSLGNQTPLYNYFYEWFPGFHFIRVPARLTLLFIFSASILASFGFNRLTNFKVYSKN